MNVMIKLSLTDEQRRTIRAAHGRGGMATREETRVFVNRAFAQALDAAPTPKAPRRKPEPAPAKASRFAAAEAASPLAVCKHCGRTKATHGRMAYSCLPDGGKPRSTMFEALTVNDLINEQHRIADALGEGDEE